MKIFSNRALSRKNMFWIVAGIVIVVGIVSISIWSNLNKLDLPNSNRVKTIEMEQFNEYSSLGSVMLLDQKSISKIIMALKDSRKALQYSINDYPIQRNYLIVRLNLEEESRTLCLYSEHGRYYIEEPYVGIYKGDQSESVEIYKIYNHNMDN